MTDLLASMFTIGIALILSICSLIFKNTILSIVSGLGWALVAMYMFGLYASGDPDYGYFTWGLGMMAVVLSLAMFFQSWWVHRRKTEQIQGKGEKFYDEDDPDFREINEIRRAKQSVRRMKGR